MSRLEWTTSESSTSACFTEPPCDGYSTACHKRLSSNRIEPLMKESLPNALFCFGLFVLLAKRFDEMWLAHFGQRLELLYCHLCIDRKFQKMTGVNLDISFATLI